MKHETLAGSTIILTIASFITRSIGMLAIIFISQLLGTEGMGIYHLMMSCFTVGVVFASSGISVAVSKLIAEYVAQKKYEYISRIMTTAFLLVGGLSFLVVVIFYFLTPSLAQYFIRDIRVIWGFHTLSLSIPFMAISSCFKGYFYATKQTRFPAGADIIEQIIKLAAVVMLLKLWLPYGINYGFLGVGIGMTLGEITSCSIMAFCYIYDHKRYQILSRQKPVKRYLFLQVISIALPIALVAYISSLLVSVENILIPKGLEKFGSSTSQSLSLYGMIKGMIVPILFFPAAFLTAFSNTLTPEIAKANVLTQKKRVRETTTRVLRFTFFLSLLVAAIFFQYADWLGKALYQDSSIGPYLRILCLLVPFMYVEVVSDSILKGLGQQISCLKYSLLDSVFRILTIYFFLPVKGIVAFITIIMFSGILTSFLHFTRLITVTQLTPSWSDWIGKPLVAALFSTEISYILWHPLLVRPSTLLLGLIVAIIFIILFYILLLFILGCITLEDLKWIKKRITHI
jgi:stage V sporulation protein B